MKSIEAAHAEAVESAAKSGRLSLSKEDEDELEKLLRANEGSKESIRSLRKFSLSRAHSIIAIFDSLLRFMERHLQFSRTILILYVVNDILFHSSEKGVSSKGPSTAHLPDSSHASIHVLSCIFPQLLHMVYLVSQLASNDSEEGKVRRTVDLWMEKGLISSEQFSAMQRIIEDREDILTRPLLPPLTSPFLSRPEEVSSSNAIPSPPLAPLPPRPPKVLPPHPPLPPSNLPPFLSLPLPLPPPPPSFAPPPAPPLPFASLCENECLSHFL